MKNAGVHAMRRAVDSSVSVRLVRRVAAGSAVCRAGAVAKRWLRSTHDRIVVGLGNEDAVEADVRTARNMDALVADSRVVDALRSWVMAPSAAWREAAVTRMAEPVLGLSLAARFQILGRVMVVASLTHVVLLAALGVPVHTLGWSFRAGLIVAGLTVAWRPETLAASWRDKAERRVGPRPTADE